MKKGIRYLRFSSDGQSHHSIERQNVITDQWMTYNKIDIVDTFIDEGYTAKNFDRPDIKQLLEFIKKNYRGIDYLVVSELTRFSREAGDAINMVKKIQRDYNICIVSAGRGAIYDCLDHNSFFMMGLEFLLGNSENIKRQNDINGGIYTAKAVKGKWIQGGRAPYGYNKEGHGDERRLVINEAQGVIVRYIFQAFLTNTPLYVIKQRAEEMGFNLKGKGRVQEILKSPLYAGYQNVKPWKENPGGLFPLKNHQPIIDMAQWHAVQEKLNKPEKSRVAVVEAFPLRGVLLCHCKKALTGAPSKGRSGAYFNYYKCQTSGHNTINATEAHKQLQEALGYMSIPERLATAIRERSAEAMEERMKDNKILLQQKEHEYDQAEKQLISVEQKWIDNQMNHETFNRWHAQLSEKKVVLKAQITQLTHDRNQVDLLLQENLLKLTDLQAVYESAELLQKQELLRVVFDNSLYYKEKCYRTTYIMPVFGHNLLILNQKKLLVLDGFNENLVRWRSQDFYRTDFMNLMQLVQLIRVA